jgi:hypothetical protein
MEEKKWEFHLNKFQQLYPNVFEMLSRRAKTRKRNFKKRRMCRQESNERNSIAAESF